MLGNGSLLLPGLYASVERQDALVVSAVVAARADDVDVAFPPKRADDEVTDGDEGAGLVPGPRLLRVLPERHIADIMLVILRGPVPRAAAARPGGPGGS